MPRFDKLADERLPEAQWPRLQQPLDLLVFEGWFLGTPAQDDNALDSRFERTGTRSDADGRWRRWCNQALARDYPALWQALRPPVVPAAAGFLGGTTLALAAGAEPAGRAAGPARHEPATAERFVQYYERVSRQALSALPALADHVVVLDGQRQVQDVR